MFPGNVIITDTLSNDLSKFIRDSDFSGVALLVDENTEAHCLPSLQSLKQPLSIIKIPSGEHNKNLKTCEQIWSAMIDSKLDRASLLVNLGGGVICDLGGFCASTFKRGIEYIHIPTTLLAQVDASIGGKTGFNFRDLKNQVGVFSEPLATLINTAFLETLDERQLKSGFAEVIKHAIIADKNHFHYLESTPFEQLDWPSIISTSLSIKNKIVNEDPFEEGTRKSLNFGHTIGHAFESYFLENGKHILHGEAIAAGMICETFLSIEKLRLERSVADRINGLIMKYFNLLDIPQPTWQSIIRLMQGDKKNQAGEMLLTLVPDLGNVQLGLKVSVEEINNSLSYYQSLRGN